jgi:UDP-4-amino-4,6-dideoxy-N-acetyl-beta-L-altrosamine transaminase
MSDPRPIPYAHHRLDDDDVAAVVRVLRGDWLTQGPAVAEFEGALCATLGAPAAAAVSSGTAALHLGMLALGIGPGDVVLVPPITFAASANAARYCGAEVAFVDVEADTGVISVDVLEQWLARHTGPGRPRAVVAVHYAGLPCDLAQLVPLCERQGLELIEDACHAPGATWTDAGGAVHAAGAGDVGAFAAFSFHPVKHVTTAEGGAVVSGRPGLVERVRRLRTHGITRDPGLLHTTEGPWWYELQELGFNYRLPDVLAALGTSQLRKHETWLRRRREIAARYRQAFAAEPGVGLQALRPGRENAYHLFPILVEGRDRVFAELVSSGIRPQVHYIPVHRQPYYRQRYGDQRLPAAEAWYEREISIPLFPSLTDAEIERVCGAVVQAVRRVAGTGERGRRPSKGTVVRP